MKRSSWRYLFTAEDIRKKLLITFLLLVLYRLAANVPVPGVDRAVISGMFANQSGATGTLLALFDLLSGGTLSNFSILAMGVYPYITAQIIIQLLVPIIPALERRLKENPREGQKWMERWTIIGTVPMALLSAIGQVNLFNQMAGTNIFAFDFGLTAGNWLPTVTLVTTMMAGTMLGVWLGQLISEFGIPNQGLSLIIFAGIVARIPANVSDLLNDEQYWWLIVVILAILALTIFAIVFVTQGRRNVPVLFPGRRVGSRMSMPVKSSLPLMINMAGMIPLIFAQSILTFPAILASFLMGPNVAEAVRDVATGIYNFFNNTNLWYSLLYFIMVVLFTFFYTDVLFANQNYGDTLKKQGAQIPGVLRGDATQKYLTRVQRRITMPGALFLGFVAVLPYVLSSLLPAGAAQSAGLFLVSSSGLLIVVGVVKDTFNIIQAELRLHGYDDHLIKG